jgi:hypothetical protein
MILQVADNIPGVLEKVHVRVGQEGMMHAGKTGSAGERLRSRIIKERKVILEWQRIQRKYQRKAEGACGGTKKP